MEKFSALESYRRMAEFVVESGVTDVRQITTVIARSCGVSFQAAVKWRDGTTKSVTMPPINRFCDKYGSSPDYISSGQLPRIRGESVSPELEEVLQMFPSASPERRKLILDILRTDAAKGN
jgi:hypothetical protein